MVEFNKSIKWPSAYFIDFRAVPFIAFGFVWTPSLYFGGFLLILFAVSAFLGKPFSVYLVALKRILFRRKLTAYPSFYQHGLKYGVAVAIVATVSSGVFPSQSYAAYQIVDSVNYGVDWKSGDPGTHDSDVISGFGNDLPFKLVLKQILPPDYIVMFTDDVDKNKKVSWKGGKPWARVLDQIAYDAGFHIQIQVSGHRVLIQNANAGQPGKLDFDNGISDAKTYSMETKTWTLHKGQYLSQNLRDWAQSVGWDINFGLPRDYIIQNRAVFKGSLIQAIKNLIRAYQEQKVMLRVQAKEHYENHVIDIHVNNGG